MYNVLINHSQIFMPKKKEVNFFFLEKEYRKGISHYERYFKNSKSATAVGEASPGYISNPVTAGRIRKHIPHCKIVLCIRNPILRAYSQYWDNRRQLIEHETFDESLIAYLKSPNHLFHRGYFTRGFYYDQIMRYFELFDRNQILILLFDDLIGDPKAFYEEILRFIDVEDSSELNYHMKSNQLTVFTNILYQQFFREPKYCKFLNRVTRRIIRVGHQHQFKKPAMSNWAYETLRRLYEIPNQKLSEMLKRDLSMWNIEGSGNK